MYLRSFPAASSSKHVVLASTAAVACRVSASQQNKGCISPQPAEGAHQLVTCAATLREGVDRLTPLLGAAADWFHARELCASVTSTNFPRVAVQRTGDCSTERAHDRGSTTLVLLPLSSLV